MQEVRRNYIIGSYSESKAVYKTGIKTFLLFFFIQLSRSSTRRSCVTLFVLLYPILSDALL